MRRRYYSMRTGKHPKGVHLNLRGALKLFVLTYIDFEKRGYFQEAFGFVCVDAGYIPGTAGEDVASYVYRKLRKERVWPVKETYGLYTEDDLFDIIEFLYDHVSKPLEGTLHAFNDCGYHWKTFDKKAGQSEYRAEINNILPDYGSYELSDIGEVYNPVIPGIEDLFDNLQYSLYPRDAAKSVYQAIRLFRHYGSTEEDKKLALKELADVLESLRPKIPKVLTKADDQALFNIANNFEIRHRNATQKTSYDKKIWLDWIFYFYLSTIDTVIKLINSKAAP